MDEPRVVDLSGRTITPGSYLIDDRGKAWRVLRTDATFRQQSLMRVVELRIRRGVITDTAKHTYARAYMTFVIERPKTARENGAIWRQRYAEEVRPEKRAALLARKARLSAALRIRRSQ